MISKYEPVAQRPAKKRYESPCLAKAGTLAELTQGFSGSIPDEQGGQTKRNPFQG